MALFTREITNSKEVQINPMKVGAYAADRTMGAFMRIPILGSGVLRRIIVTNTVVAVTTGFTLHLFDELLSPVSQDILADDKAFASIINVLNARKQIATIAVTNTWETKTNFLRQEINNLNLDFSAPRGLIAIAVTTGTPTYGVAQPFWFKFMAAQKQ